jgi:hypothetical protein
MTIERYFGVDGEAREDYLGSLTPEELLQLGIDLTTAATTETPTKRGRKERNSDGSRRRLAC